MYAAGEPDMPPLLLTAVLLFWGPALLLAEVLRRAGRLGPPLEAAAFGGIAVVLLWFALTGGAPTQLLDEFVTQMEPLLAGSVDPAQTRALLALTLPGLLALSLLIVFLVLAAQFESFIHPVTIMLTVPAGAAGAIYAMAIGGLTLNVYSQIGIILLAGHGQ